MFGRKKKNTFRLEDDGFSYGDAFYNYADIQHITFARILEKQSVNFLPVGEAESAYLVVTLSNGQKIGDAVSEAGFMVGFNSDKQPEINSITDVYLYLSRKTFSQRVKFYTDQVDRLGYFDYDKCRFFPREQKIQYKSKVFYRAETTFKRSASSVELVRKGSGMLGKMKRELSLALPPQFVTAIDRDVIFSLLAHYFNVRWSN